MTAPNLLRRLRAALFCPATAKAPVAGSRVALLSDAEILAIQARSDRFLNAQQVLDGMGVDRTAKRVA